MVIYHIILPEIWEKFAGAPQYAAESLSSEGFIHCSFKEQLDAVLKRYYSGIEKVVILEIDPEKLSSRYVEEPSTNNEIYPHIYGPVNSDAIINAAERNL